MSVSSPAAGRLFYRPRTEFHDLLRPPLPSQLRHVLGTIKVLDSPADQAQASAADGWVTPWTRNVNPWPLEDRRAPWA